MRPLPLLFLFVMSGGSPAGEILLQAPSDLQSAAKNAQPGDVLILPEGVFHDTPLAFHAEGTAEKPVVLKSANPGQTVFTGNSQLSFSGRFLRIEGLVFRNPGPDSEKVIEFRTDSRTPASHCLLVDCLIQAETDLPEKARESKWCSLYGTANVVERCGFLGKTSPGTTLVVWLVGEGTGLHTIRGCYFGPRPKLGKNGGETIRLGDSATSGQNAGCLVSGNLFDRCNGEAEIISNKSCGNRILGNTFWDCEGALTLRHGHRAEVRGNLFQGHDLPRTGGIRIIGEDHLVTQNTLLHLGGEGTRSALTFMNGIPNTPSNGYQQVKRVLVENNLIIACKVPLTIGMAHDKSCTLPPTGVILRGNVIHCPDVPLMALLSTPQNWTWENNTLTAGSLGGEWPGLILSQNPAPMVNQQPLSPQSTGPLWRRRN